jgi:hypothetical protein
VKWLRWDANASRNPKLHSVRADGMFLYLRGLEYCAEHETDGVIPAAVVRSLVDDFVDLGLWITQPKRAQVSGKCPPSVRVVTRTESVTPEDDDAADDAPAMSREAFERRRRRLVARLIAAGLWHEHPLGYEVNDYLQYQPERSEIEERNERKRAADRERKRRERARKQGAQVSAKCPNVTHVTPHTIRGYSLRNNPPVEDTLSQGGTPALGGAGAPVAAADEKHSDVEAVLSEHGPQAIVRRLSDAKRMG